MQDLKLDISDLNNLLAQATRKSSKTLLQTQIAALEQKLRELELDSQTPNPSPQQKNPEKPVQFEEIKKYSWDQELNFVK